jgi:uncharacterized repeat protein (TIGR03803 family)
MKKMHALGARIIVLLALIIAAIAAPAQTFTSLHSFDSVDDGSNPNYGSLVLGVNGNYYGVNTSAGPNGGAGTVFKITPSGTLTTLHTFCLLSHCADGALPHAGLVRAADGNFYGTTTLGGANQNGTVFEITPKGTLSTLYSFCSKTSCADGNNALGGLVQGSDGNFYGTTAGGGANNDGTVFKIRPSGTLTTLHSFDNTDGAEPAATLVQGSDGNFYGTTQAAGADNHGTVFKITPKGALTTLYNFCSQTGCGDGGTPLGALVQASNGKFYGTTQLNGTSNEGVVYAITSAGTFTMLHSFDGADGVHPNGSLVQATDGKLYGTTSQGGTNNLGTVFKITLTGTVTTLHSFDGTDGSFLNAGVVQGPDGAFYGTSADGGTSGNCNGGCGTVFKLATGLAAFVEITPTSGMVGTRVVILGTNLKGTTAVTFNGTAATFTVVSSTEIKTTVPVGATTGFVKVTTPKKALKSNVVFRVTK